MMGSARPHPLPEHVLPSFRLKQRYVVDPFPGAYLPDAFHPLGQKRDHVVVIRVDLFSQKSYLFWKARRPDGGHIVQSVDELAILKRSQLLFRVAESIGGRTMDFNHQTIKEKV